MLKTRVITAIFIALAALGAVFLASPWAFQVIISVLLLIGSWEFRRLAGLGRVAAWILFILQAAIIITMAMNWELLQNHALAFLAAGFLCWCLMFLRLLTWREDRPADLNFRAISFFSSMAAITFCWFSLAWLRGQPNGDVLILLLLFIIWAADIGAYFSGRQFGKRKLAASISPKKTWEGVAGGLLLAVLAAGLVLRIAPGPTLHPAGFVALTGLTVFASVGGDLFISIHKRTVRIKDAGKLFPGHGGVLDRFDSLMAGSAIFAFGIRVLGQ